jgi:hypothetical protein
MTLDGLGIFFDTVRSYPGVFLVVLILAALVIGSALSTHSRRISESFASLFGRFWRNRRGVVRDHAHDRGRLSIGKARLVVPRAPAALRLREPATAGASRPLVDEPA